MNNNVINTCIINNKLKFPILDEKLNTISLSENNKYYSNLNISSSKLSSNFYLNPTNRVKEINFNYNQNYLDLENIKRNFGNESNSFSNFEDSNMKENILDDFNSNYEIINNSDK